MFVTHAELAGMLTLHIAQTSCSMSASWCALLAHRTRVKAHLVGIWQQLAGTPVHCYYYYYGVHLSLDGISEIIKAHERQHDRISCQSFGNIAGLAKAALLELQ